MWQCSFRVSFGINWFNEFIMEIYKEDIVCFCVLLSVDVEEDFIKLFLEGKVFKLCVLQVYNFMVYWWNCFCYGVSLNGQFYFCIENWVIFVGLIVVDEVANVVFWLGVMVGMYIVYFDIWFKIGWEDVQDNFIKFVKFGIDIKFIWFGDQKVMVIDFLQQEFILLVWEGLK